MDRKVVRLIALVLAALMFLGVFAGVLSALA